MTYRRGQPPLENPGLQRGRNTAHRRSPAARRASRPVRARRHDRAGDRGVHAGAGQQAGHHLVQPCRITRDDHRFGWGRSSSTGDLVRHFVSVADRVNRKPRHVHRSKQRPPLSPDAPAAAGPRRDVASLLGLDANLRLIACDGSGIVLYPLRQFRVTTDRRVKGVRSS